MNKTFLINFAFEVIRSSAGGMQTLGKAVSARRMPPPANLPSLAKSTGVLSSTPSQGEHSAASTPVGTTPLSNPLLNSQQNSTDSLPTPTSSAANQMTIAAVVSGGSPFSASWPTPSTPVQTQSTATNKTFPSNGESQLSNGPHRPSESSETKPAASYPSTTTKWGQNVSRLYPFLYHRNQSQKCYFFVVKRSFLNLRTPFLSNSNNNNSNSYSSNNSSNSSNISQTLLNQRLGLKRIHNQLSRKPFINKANRQPHSQIPL